MADPASSSPVDAMDPARSRPAGAAMDPDASREGRGEAGEGGEEVGASREGGKERGGSFR